MTKKIVWIMLGCLVTLSLVMASCGKAPATPTGPAPTTAAPTTAAPTATTTPTPGAPTAPVAEKPKYGGVLRVGFFAQPNNYDPLFGQPFGTQPFHVVNEELWRGDWAKGPAGGYGSNESSWMINNDERDLKAGYLAESWKMELGAETASMTWKIRRGVRWALNPDSEASRLVNGREMTVDDILFSNKTVLSNSKTYLYQSEPDLRKLLAEGRFKITSPEPWTVKWEIPWEWFHQMMYRVGDFHYIVPQEVWGRPGNMVDWKASVGTGAYMLTDVVADTSQTFKKNPNYWMKDPVGQGKGNQLPYIDEIRWLTIPDRGTMMAALRTAKIDVLGTITWEEGPRLLKENPKLKHVMEPFSSSGGMIAMRLDKPPFNDLRVRQALMLAIDFQGIKKNLFGDTPGTQIMTWPYPYFSEFGAALVSFDEAPDSVKELYSYKPDKAKKLLAEAGYPQGFKTELVIDSTPLVVDYYSVYKDMWSKIGVDVTLRVQERGPLVTTRRNKTFDQMLISGGQPGPVGLYTMLAFNGPGENNYSSVNDPKVAQAYEKVQRLVLTDIEAARRIHRDLLPYVLEQVWRIPEVKPPTYTIWWPWLKNYSGENTIGHANRIWGQFTWLDQDLKKSMGY